MTASAPDSAPDSAPGRVTETAVIPTEISRPTAPVALTDTGDPALAAAPEAARIEAIAAEFSATMTQSGIDPADPAYRKLWDAERTRADTLFRSLYGGHVWMRQHVRIHQAAAVPGM